MMVDKGPGFIDKSLLVGGRAIYLTSKVPGQVNEASAAYGHGANLMVSGVAQGVKAGIDSWQPKGIAKWFSDKFLAKVIEASDKSEAMAQENKAIVGSIAEGVENIGLGVGGAMATPYLHAYDVQGSKDAFKGVLDVPVKHILKFDPPGGGGSPPPTEPPPTEPPPTEPPPGDTPPGDTPPGDTPPGDTPPGDTPPGDTPPGDTPPGDTPPGDTPPGDTPPGEQPPAEEPPAEQPPAEQPPAEDPPADDGSDLVDPHVD